MQNSIKLAALGPLRTLHLRVRLHSLRLSASPSPSPSAARLMSSLTLEQAVKPIRKDCAPIGAHLKGKNKSKGDPELPDFVSPPPKNAMERREWVSD